MAARSTKSKSKNVNASEHPLAALIPGEWYADDYIPRMVNGVEDINALRMARRVRHNTLIEGPTGPGKTSCVMAFGATESIPVVYVPCNGGADPASLFGQWMPDGEGGWLFVEGPVTVAAKHGGIIYLDEVNMMPPKVAAVLHGALDKRRTIVVYGGDADSVQKATITLHPECQIVASYNPDYEDTRPLNEAFKNRFALKMVFDYDPQLERQFVSIPLLVDIAELLRSAKDNGELRTPTSPNMLVEFEMFSELGYEFAVQNFINSYHADERSAVREVMEAHRVELEAQVAQFWGDVPDEDESDDGDDGDES